VRLFPKETWSYAVLLVILFGIATIAVWQTIVFLEARVPASEIGIVTGLLWTLTMGFMLIAGAFGMWSIQFAAGAESRRTVSTIVSSMDYIKDGLLAVDHHDRVTGCNPAGIAMLHDVPIARRPLLELFPFLRPDDIDVLLHQEEPQEVERSHVDGGLTHSLRFRSQPSRGITLLLISDVTTAQARRSHHQQAAKLQLVGQLARAVANDFNNLLCGIAGHAALLPRLPPGAKEMAESIQAIAQSSEHGIALAGHLMELSRPTSGSFPTRMIADHIRNAATTLGDALPTGWKVETEIKETPSTSLTGMQIEQVVINLGQIIASEAGPTGVISIILGPPGSHPLLNIAETFSGGIVLAGTGADLSMLHATTTDSSDDSGLLLAVIHSIMDGAGGVLDKLASVDGRPIFRIALPVTAAFESSDEQSELPFDVDHYLANWRILVAGRRHHHTALTKRLKEAEATVTTVDSITAILAATESETRLDSVVLDWPLLGAEEEGTLKALCKLAPAAGIVVLRDSRPLSRQHQLPGVVYVPEQARVERVLMAMVEARSLAAARNRLTHG